MKILKEVFKDYDEIISSQLHQLQFISGQQTSSIVHTVLCYVSPKPLDCVKEQAGRMLEGWEQIVETKRHELLGE